MIYIDIENLDEVVRRLQTLSPAARRAANRAVRKTVTWAYNSIIRQGAAAADVNQRGLRRGIEFPRGKRVYRRDITVKSLSSEASVYTGYNPLKTHYVGAIPKWRRGTTPRVRRHRFPGAFVAEFKNGYRGIFKRDPTKLTRNRQPKLVEQTVSLEPVNTVVRRIRPQTGPYLRGVLAKELEIELAKRSR